MDDTPDGRLLESVHTFAALRALFAQEDLTIIECFAFPRGTSRCTEILQAQNIADAKALLTKAIDELDNQDVRDVIMLILCPHHQTARSHLYKKRFIRKWTPEFGGRDMSIGNDNFLKSPYRVQRDGSPFLDRRRSTPTSTPSSARSRPTPPSIRSEGSLPTYEDSPTVIRQARRVAAWHGTSNAREHGTRPQLSQPVQETASLGMSSDNMVLGFERGVAHEYAPHVIVEDVEGLLTRPIDQTKCGALYAFQDLDGPYVKIGFSEQSSNARRAQIRADTKRRLDGVNCVWKSNIPLQRLYRLEKLVHADLAWAQVTLNLVQGGRRRRRYEWFQITFQEAQRCIDFWMGVVHNYSFPITLKAHVDRSFLNADSQDTRHAINADHARRLQFWKESIIDNEQVQKTSPEPVPGPSDMETSNGLQSDIESAKYNAATVMQWFAGCALLGVLPALFQLPEWFEQAAILVSFLAWTRYKLMLSGRPSAGYEEDAIMIGL